MSSRLVTLLLLALAACGNPDNLITGGISAQGGAPVVIFDHINSAIHNVATITDAQTGDKRTATVILMSDHGDLCGALAKRPDYLKNPDDKLIALMMVAPADRVGTFNPQQSIETRYSAILAAPGGGVAPNLYPTSGGFLAVTDFSFSGEAKGSFDFIFRDASANHEFQGRYKTRPCDALAAASLP